MSHVEDIRKISGHEMIFALLFLSGAICPGIATIWFFEPTILKELGTVMIALLAVSITLPIISLNVLTMMFTFILSSQTVTKFFIGTENNSTFIAKIFVILGAIIAMLVLSTSLLISFSLSLKVYQFLCIAGSLQIVCVLGELLAFRRLGLQVRILTQKNTADVE